MAKHRRKAPRVATKCEKIVVVISTGGTIMCGQTEPPFFPNLKARDLIEDNCVQQQVAYDLEVWNGSFLTRDQREKLWKRPVYPRHLSMYGLLHHH